jgi:transposase
MLVKDRVRMMARCRMRLIQFDLLPSSFERVLTIKIVKGILESKEVSDEVKTSMSYLLSVWEQIEREMTAIRKCYRERGQEDKFVQQYMKLPGIGIITATTLADELLDCSQFKSEKELFSFIGLTPSEHSSGEKTRKGRITRQGNPQIRFMLIESAWIAIRVDPALKSFYGKVAARRGSHKAIVAVARKLIGRARAIMKYGTDYELNYNKTTPQQLAA